MDKFKQLSPSTWSWLLRNILLPGGDLVFGQRMMHHLRYLETAQWWSPERILQIRDRELNKLIEVAYNEVEFYRTLMDQCGIKPWDIQSQKDLPKLPIVEKEMLRSNYPERTVRSTGQLTYEACTSGSTGTNFCVQEDAETAGMYRAAFMLALEWSGWQLGEPHVQTGITINRSMDRRIKDTILRCHYVSAYKLSDPDLEMILNYLEENKIKYLWGYPGSVYILAKYAQKNGWNRSLKSIVTWGDSLYPHYRETIEKAFATSIFDTYGCGEGIQIAAQCDRGNYHIHGLDTIVEFLDDEDRPASSGCLGHIIVTRLHPGPMPLIRYRIGDMGVRGEERLCECGRGFGLMDSISGRDTDIVITPSGNRLIVHFFTGIFEHFKEIEKFQVIQETEDLLVIRIVPKKDYSDDTSSRLVAKLKSLGATEMEFEIEQIEDIPLPPSGKHRFVISKLWDKYN